MAWEQKVLSVLDKQYDNDDQIKQTWSITRKVNEAESKKYARELMRTVYWTKDGELKNFTVTLTTADINWIVANKDAIKAAMAPSPKAEAKPAATPAVIEETSF